MSSIVDLEFGVYRPKDQIQNPRESQCCLEISTPPPRSYLGQPGPREATLGVSATLE